MVKASKEQTTVIILELSPEEADVIAAMCVRASGSPTASPRGICDQIRAALKTQGIYGGYGKNNFSNMEEPASLLFQSSWQNWGTVANDD